MADFTEQALKEIEKEFGEGVVRDGQSILDKDEVIIPMSPALDVGLSGGVPKPGFVTISGKAKLGKTTTALSFARNCQRAGMKVFYMNVEHRLKKKNILGIRGLKYTKPDFVVFESDEPDEKEGKKATILTAQNFLNMALKLLKTVPNIVIIFDSFSMLLEAREADGGVGTETRGGGAKLLAQFCREAAAHICVNKSIVIGIMHLMANTGNMGSSVLEKGGNAVQYALDVKLRGRGEKPWVVGEKVIGQIVTWEIAESALGAPGRTVDSYIRYGVGVDDLYELFVMACDIGLIEQKGAWYNFTFLGDTPAKFQGGEKAYQALLDKPEWAAKLGQVFAQTIGLQR